MDSFINLRTQAIIAANNWKVSEYFFLNLIRRIALFTVAPYLKVTFSDYICIHTYLITHMNTYSNC